jgi:RNA polymerase sigma-70 factor, ECF subfamily
MLDEEALLRRTHDLDQDALAQIHDAYYGAIYRYISFRVSDPQTVEDLAGEVFVRFLTALRKPVGRPNTIRPWLYGTASRVVKEHYRHQARWNEVSLDESMSAPGKGPEQSAEEMWTRHELREGIRKLTKDQQEVLALRFGGEVSIAEVARVISKSEGAVKMLQARALAALAHYLDRRK